MFSIIAGIEPQLGMKIRMGLMKFNPLKFQSKNRKKKNRKSRQTQNEVVVDSNLHHCDAVDADSSEHFQPPISEELNDETAGKSFSEDQEIAGRKIVQFILRHRRRVDEEHILLAPTSPLSSPSLASESTSSSSSSMQSVRSDKEVTFGVTLSLLTIGNGQALSEKNSAVLGNQDTSRVSTKERKSMKDFSDSSSDDVSEQELLVGGDRLEYDEFSESVHDDCSINSRGENGDDGRNNHDTEFSDTEGDPQRYLSKKANEIHLLVDEMRSTIRKNFKSFVADSSLDKENPHNTHLLQSIEAKPNQSIFRVVHEVIQDKLNRNQPTLDDMIDKISVSDSETEAEVQKRQEDSNANLRERAIDFQMKRPRNRRRPVPIRKGPKYVLQLDGGSWVDESGFYRARSPEIHIGRDRKVDQSRVRFQKSNETRDSQPVLSSSSSSSCMVSDDSDVDEVQADKLANFQKKQTKRITRSYLSGDRALTLQDYIILGHSMLKKVDQSMLSDIHNDTQKSHRMINEFLSKDSMNLEKISSDYEEKKGRRNQTKNLLSAVKLALISLDGRLLSREQRVGKREAEINKKAANEHVSKSFHQLESHSLRSGSLWGDMLCDMKAPTSNVHENSSGDTNGGGSRVLAGIDTVPHSSDMDFDDQASLANSSSFAASFSDDANLPTVKSSEHDIQHDSLGAAVVQKDTTISSGPKATKQTPMPTGKGLYIISQSYKSAPKLGPVVKSMVAPKTKSKQVPIVLARNYSSVVLGTPYTTNHSNVDDSWQVLDNKSQFIIGTSTNNENCESLPYFPERENEHPADMQARQETGASNIEVNDLEPISSKVIAHESNCNFSEKELNCETPGTQSPLVYSPPSTAHFPRKRELSELSLEVVSCIYEQMLADMNPLLSDEVYDSLNVKEARVLSMNDEDESSGPGDSDTMKVKEPLLRIGSSTWYVAESDVVPDSLLLTSPSELSVASKPVTAVDVKSNTACAQSLTPAIDVFPKEHVESHIAVHLSPLEAFLARSKQQPPTTNRNSAGNAKNAVVAPQQPSRKLHPQKILRAQLTHHQPAARTEFKPEPPAVIISSKIASPTKHRKLTG